MVNVNLEFKNANHLNKMLVKQTNKQTNKQKKKSKNNKNKT